MDALLSRLFYFLLMMRTNVYVETSVVTDMDRLYAHIFTNYTPKTLPLIQPFDTAIVNITAFVVNLNNFHEIYGELSVTLSFYTTWVEPRISWKPHDYGNVTEITVWPEDLWRPQLLLLQASDTVSDMGNTPIRPIIYRDGTVFWIPSKVLKVSCSVDVAKFPFDFQTCEISLLSWSVSSASMVYLPKQREVLQNYYKRNSQWELMPSVLESCPAHMQSTACLNLKMILKRRSEFFTFYIVIPIMFLGISNNLVFLIPPASGERTSVAVTVFLSFVVYMGIINDVVPQSSKPIALIYYYVTFLLIYSGTIVFACILSLRVYEKRTDVPKRLRTTIWVFGLYFLRFRKSEAADGKPTERKVFNSMAPDTNENKLVKTDPISVIENNNCNTEESMADEHREHLHDFADRVREWKCTWTNVGNTFDAYCCIGLYLILGVASVIIISFWQKA